MGADGRGGTEDERGRSAAMNERGRSEGGGGTKGLGSVTDTTARSEFRLR